MALGKQPEGSDKKTLGMVLYLVAAYSHIMLSLQRAQLNKDAGTL